MYKRARNQSGLSLDEASFRVHIGRKSLCNYEKGKRIPPPDVVLNMSEVYGDPAMTLRYCRECPIGQKYSYEVLDNVNLDPATVVLKLVSEYREAGQVLDRLQELTVNKNRQEDFVEDEWQEYMKGIHELLDLEHNIEILKISISKWCDIGELIGEHNQKCRDKKYVVAGM